MARVRRSYEVAIDYDRRILHPDCPGGFSVGLHDQFGVSHAIIEPRHVAASNDLRAGRQHRPSADASDNSASSADVLHELSYARIFGKQGRAFCTTWNEDTHIVLGPGFRYCTLDIQQAGSREIAVNLDRLLARGHHLDLVASLIEGDLGKEVLLLLKRVSDQSGNLWASVVHGFCLLCFCVDPNSQFPPLGDEAAQLWIRLRSAALRLRHRSRRSTVTSARLSATLQIHKIVSATQGHLSIASARTQIVGWSAVGFGLMPRDATTAFDQHGITELVRAVAVLVECLRNLVVTRAGERDRAGSLRGPQRGTRANADWPVPLTIYFAQ